MGAASFGFSDSCRSDFTAINIAKIAVVGFWLFY